TTVTFYWGEADGGTNPASWTESIVLPQAQVGSVVGQINTGLGFPRKYFARVQALNSVGADWTPIAMEFVPQAGALGFTPLDFSGLRLWLDASDVNATGDRLALFPGENVSVIKDKSGRNRNATQ